MEIVRFAAVSEITPQGMYPLSPFTTRSRKASKPWDWMLELSYDSEIWQASWQCCCRGACQISEWLEKFKPKYRGFDTADFTSSYSKKSVEWNRLIPNYNKTRQSTKCRNDSMDTSYFRFTSLGQTRTGWHTIEYISCIHSKLLIDQTTTNQ